MVVDWEVRWALEASCGPGHLKPAKGYEGTILDLYRPLWERGIGVEFLGRDEPLDARRLLILPMLFLVEPAMAERVRDFVEAGGTLADICDDTGGDHGSGLTGCLACHIAGFADVPAPDPVPRAAGLVVTAAVTAPQESRALRPVFDFAHAMRAPPLA
jgi:hypothetical protein